MLGKIWFSNVQLSKYEPHTFKIKRKLSNIFCTSLITVIFTVPMDLDVKIKAVMIGAVFLIVSLILLNLPYRETSHTFILGIWETCHSIEVLISESISFKIMIILYLFHIRCYNFRKFYPYLFKKYQHKNDFYIYHI